MFTASEQTVGVPLTSGRQAPAPVGTASDRHTVPDRQAPAPDRQASAPARQAAAPAPKPLTPFRVKNPPLREDEAEEVREKMVVQFTTKLKNKLEAEGKSVSEIPPAVLDRIRQLAQNTVNRMKLSPEEQVRKVAELNQKAAAKGTSQVVEMAERVIEAIENSPQGKEEPWKSLLENRGALRSLLIDIIAEMRREAEAALDAGPEA